MCNIQMLYYEKECTSCGCAKRPPNNPKLTNLDKPPGGVGRWATVEEKNWYCPKFSCRKAVNGAKDDVCGRCHKTKRPEKGTSS
jgi:hypothetical protein